MENEITAHKAGVIAELPISEGAAISVGDTLAVIKAPRVATRSTFSAWIFFIAPLRRVSGSGASAPCSSSADR